MKGLLVVVVLSLLAACATEEGPTYLSREALLSPESCKDCHAQHVAEWSGSMHAYASKDPVFLAMNRRGQRETNGELGDFCVQCHAPMALRLGLTTDGLNLEELPEYVQGVTCFFCHSVVQVTGTHNAPLELADDGVMRGGYVDPVANTAHASAYSPHLDRDHIKSADLCGSCHDIVTPKGVHLERTFAEWKASLFSHEEPDAQQTCGNCHMAGRDDVAADFDGVPLRRVHDHKMVGVDIALTEFPEMDAQLVQIQRELNTSLLPQLCVEGNNNGKVRITVNLENLAAGHSWPSGATQDRRAWVEVLAFDADDDVVFESGVIAEGEVVADHPDPNLWLFRDKAYDADGKETHLFWEIASVDSNLLPAPSAHSPTEPGYIDVHRFRHYIFDGMLPERVTMRVRIRAMGLDVLDDLIASGDLDPVYRDRIITLDLKFTQLEWRADAQAHCIPEGHD